MVTEATIGSWRCAPCLILPMQPRKQWRCCRPLLHCVHPLLPPRAAGGQQSRTAWPGSPSTPSSPSAAPASPQPSPRRVPALPAKAPTVCQPCPLVSLLPQPFLVIHTIPAAPLVQAFSRDFGVTVSGRAWLSHQRSRKGEGSRLRYLPDDVVIWSGSCYYLHLQSLPMVKGGTHRFCNPGKILRKPGGNKKTRRNLH